MHPMTTTKYGRLLSETFGGTLTGAELYGKLRRLERRGARLALRLCNGPEFPSEAEREAEEMAIVAGVRKLLCGSDYPLVLNLDPRGYALKISDEWMRENREKVGDWMCRDWGGYGLIAPEIKLPTIADIKARTLEKCPHFFTRGSMRFFGQRMRDFGVFAIGERVFIRAKRPYGWTTREFTGDDLEMVADADLITLGLSV